MKGNYSPFNRTYKFICLQNQLAHIKNRSSVKSTGKSNISIRQSPDKMFKNEALKVSSYQSTRPNFHSLNHVDDSMFGDRKHAYSFVEPYRVIHKNEAFDRKKKMQQFYQNQRLAKKLCNVSCCVIPKNKTQKEFEDHLDHVSIARRYGQSGELKQLLKVSEYNSMTASKARKSISQGNDHCNVSAYHSATKMSSAKKKKSSKGLVKYPKSNIIRLY